MYSKDALGCMVSKFVTNHLPNSIPNIKKQVLLLNHSGCTCNDAKKSGNSAVRKITRWFWKILWMSI